MARTETTPFIRRHRPSDRADVADIRVRTAHEGGDSSGLCPGPELMPSLFAHPHVELEPDFAFVLDDGTGRAVGHVLGAPDTAGRTFYGRLGCERSDVSDPGPVWYLGRPTSRPTNRDAPSVTR
ncbi:hypothetical protein [Streptomyces filamentosus]|uniref:hypothetical protein n=1 Tax=Streptomyces filamentosus TaxID=67294 RepID=UPI00123B6137|nr:hypothetical protein [Streptomyces filamentosus]KAA6220074.1 hypothetical protein CP979_00400 [Streptomyces filamentosus]